MMPNGDPEGRIFLSYLYTNNGFFFLLTSVFFYLFQNKLPEAPEYAKMKFHLKTLIDVLGKIAWIFYPRVKSKIFLSGVQENRISHTPSNPWEIYKSNSRTSENK